MLLYIVAVLGGVVIAGSLFIIQRAYLRGEIFRKALVWERIVLVGVGCMLLTADHLVPTTLPLLGIGGVFGLSTAASLEVCVRWPEIRIGYHARRCAIQRDEQPVSMDVLVACINELSQSHSTDHARWKKQFDQLEGRRKRLVAARELFLSYRAEQERAFGDTVWINARIAQLNTELEVVADFQAVVWRHMEQTWANAVIDPSRL